MEKSYPGLLTDENICHIFRDTADFIHRQLRCADHTLYAYAIDGLIAASAASDYIIKPITEHLHADTMQQLHMHAMSGMIYNAVAVPCKDLDTVARLLVNGFCVVLFPGVGAIGFEVKTPDVSIKVAPDRSDLIETRVIGGIKYILINAEENVEVNGVSIRIGDKESQPV